MSHTRAIDFVTETCCYKGCGVMFAFTRDYFEQVHRDRRFWYCPNGHQQHYTGKTDEQKLRESTARETALRDQLEAATRDAEDTRVALLRDRHRFANGVCPCCTRSFENVRRHIATQHPDYDPGPAAAKAPKYRCSCGYVAKSFRGLRTHQGLNRRDTWARPGTGRYSAHLTEV